MFDVVFDDGEVTYKLMTTVFLEVKNTGKKTGDFMIMGNATKKKNVTKSVPEKEDEKFHLMNMCKMVETQETYVR